MKHKTFTLTIILFLLFNSGLFAQWESLGNNIIRPNHRVWSIKVAPDRSVWATATFDNFPPTNQTPKVYRSADEGNTWESSAIIEAVSNKAWDISPIDKDNAFIAINNVGLYKTSNAGQDWTRDTTFNYAPLYVHFFNAQEGWILSHTGSSQIMSVTEDGGESWTDISYLEDFPEGTSLPPFNGAELIWASTYSTNSAYAYDDESIILGTTLGSFWISNDKGKNWERRTSPLVPLGMEASLVAMKDKNTFMIAGDFKQNPNEGTATLNFTTSDGGITWVGGRSGVTGAASHYIPNSDGTFIMVGHNNFGWGSEGTAISYDYGENWEILDNTSIIAIDFLDENTGYGSCCNNFWATANGQIHKWNFDFATSTFEEIQSEKVKVFPNPASSYIMVLLNNEFQSEELMVEIHSLNGQLYSTTSVQANNEIRVQTSNLPRGIYSLSITGKDKRVIKKFIKEE